eukprot:SAG31_NODE_7555_length_1656_cov_1.312139_1_plen_31_part_10
MRRNQAQRIRAQESLPTHSFGKARVKYHSWT